MNIALNKIGFFVMSEKYCRTSFRKNHKTLKLSKPNYKKNDYTSSGFSLLNYALKISKVFGTSDHIEVLFSKYPKNSRAPVVYDLKIPAGCRKVFLFFLGEDDNPTNLGI